MPTYEYKCPECDKIEEARHSMRVHEIIICEDCDMIMERQISKPYIQFKGKGFHCNGS